MLKSDASGFLYDSDDVNDFVTGIKTISEGKNKLRSEKFVMA